MRSDLLLALLVGARAATAQTTPVWQTVTCATSPITDATGDHAARWAAADASTAWTAVVDAWNSYTGGTLGFPEFVSNFFQGPGGWDCTNIGNTECSTTVQCQDVQYPAGYLILNSLSTLHQIHNYYWQALIEAATQMGGQVGVVTNTFAPQLAPNTSATALKDLLDAFTFIIGVGSNYVWNIVFKEAAIWSSQTDYWRGFYKDVFNGAISTAITTAKDNLPTSTALNVQNGLDSALSTFFTEWENSESLFTESLFSGNSTTLTQLGNMLANGIMLAMPSNTVGTSMSSLNAQVQQMMYGELIIAAWNNAPGPLGPFILATGHTCTSTLPEELVPFMTQATHTDTGVCWNGNQFYVLGSNYQWSGQDSGAPSNPDIFGMPFIPLPGGTHSVLDGNAWGGITLDDIVISAYSAYLDNNQNNGYQMPSGAQLAAADTSATNLMLDGGILTAGLFQLNVCTNLYRTLAGPGVGQDATVADFPCWRVNGL